MVELLLLVPLVTALLCGISRSERAIYVFSVAGSLITALVAIPYCYQAFFEGPVDTGLWYLDPLSGLFMVVIVTITALVSLYSVQYLEHDRKEGEANLKDLRYYHVLLHLFAFSMLMVVVVDSLGLMWIAVEGTTLVSAFLVGFYKRSEAMEASWKYLIICSVGITLALLGIILLYASSVDALGENADTEAIQVADLGNGGFRLAVDLRLCRGGRDGGERGKQAQGCECGVVRHGVSGLTMSASDGGIV